MLVLSSKKGETEKLNLGDSQMLVRRQSLGSMLNKDFKFSVDFKQFQKLSMLPRIKEKRVLKLEPINIHTVKIREKYRSAHKSVDKKNKEFKVNSAENKKVQSLKCINLMLDDYLNTMKLKKFR